MLKIQLQRVYRRLRREVTQLAYFKRRSDARYRARLEFFSLQLPPLDPVASNLVETLNMKGIAVTSLSQLKIPLTADLLTGVDHLLPELMAVSQPAKREFLIKVPSHQLVKYPAIFLWGLDERWLTIAEHYLGLPVAYHGVYFRRDVANQIIQRTRRWHLDKEDRRMLKIIIYLNDVDEDSGVFQYISDNLTPDIVRSLGYNYGTITDQRMKTVVPPSEWISCGGTAGTVIVFDPARVFHRGKTPVASDRFTLFFDYTSNIPERPYYCKSAFSRDELTLMLKGSSDRQKQCVFWRDRPDPQRL